MAVTRSTLRRSTLSKYYPLLEELWLKHYGLTVEPTYLNCFLFLEHMMYVTRSINVISSDDQTKQVARHLSAYLKVNYKPTSPPTPRPIGREPTPPIPDEVFIPGSPPPTRSSIWK